VTLQRRHIALVWLLGFAFLLGLSVALVVPNVEKDLVDDVRERLQDGRVPADILVVGRDVHITVDDQIGEIRAIEALAELDRAHHVTIEVAATAEENE